MLAVEHNSDHLFSDFNRSIIVQHRAVWADVVEKLSVFGVSTQVIALISLAVRWQPLSFIPSRTSSA